jgi:drug/metabolite transporter (DMT)-like permease
MAGLLLAFAGVAGAFSESGHGGPHQLLGDAMGVLGAVLWGGTTLAIRATALSRASAEQTLMSQLAVSAVALLAASAWMGEAWPAQIRPLSWAALGFQTVIVTFASYLLWFWLMRHYPATKISAFTLLTPVFGLLAGVLLLGEPATPRILLALAAVAVGIALVSRPAPAAPSSTPS